VSQSQATSNPAPYVLGLLAVFGILLSLAQSGHLPIWIPYVLLGISVPFLIVFLMVHQSGWHRLAAHYPLRSGFAGPWRTCRTVVLSPVAQGARGYESSKVWLVFAMRVGADEEALYLSGASVFRPVFPPVRIPWSAIDHVRYFEASPWVNLSPPVKTIRFNYDPGYSGPFVEIQVADPSVFIQVPRAEVKEALAHLPA
jgi:hypothetical protein